MWRVYAWGIVFGACIGGLDNLCGQDRPPPGNLVARSNWGRLEIISGRVTLSDTRLGRKSTFASGDPSTGVKETLSFSTKSPNTAWLHYEYADGEQRLIVDIERSKRVTIERLPHPGSQLATVRFRQPERGEITLAIDSKERSREIVADGFWQLALADPEAFRDHLAPILQSLRPDWRLEWTVGRVEAALLDVARRGQLPDTERMEQLVAELRHSKFLCRQAADRQLRELGQLALAYLCGLDERTLDVEQRTRIRRIKKSLKINDKDTPARVAAWLIGDIGTWLVLLDREEEKKRIVAVKHLVAISGKRIAFDPLADQIERLAQIDRLRIDFGLDRPILISRKSNGTRSR